MTEFVSSSDPDDFVFIPMIGPDQKNIEGVEIGIPHALVIGDLRYVDGYSANWSTAMVRTADRVGIAPVPLILFAIPDYPRDDAVTFALGPDDARTIASLLNRTAAKAEAAMRQAVTDYERRKERIQRHGAHEVRAVRPVVVCVVEGCNRTRKFFNEAGEGYCGRHAELIGIRPKGKVT